MQLNNEDNGWYERGELPRVGEIVDYKKKPSIQLTETTQFWIDGDKLEVLAIRGGEVGDIAVVWNIRDRTASGAILDVLRPIKSERERVIESAAEIIRNEQGARAINSRDCPHKASAVALANAGLLRLPESDKS